MSPEDYLGFIHLGVSVMTNIYRVLLGRHPQGKSLDKRSPPRLMDAERSMITKYSGELRIY